jgi:hypothetical protein
MLTTNISIMTHVEVATGTDCELRPAAKKIRIVKDMLSRLR